MLSFTLLGQTVLSENSVPLVQFRSQKEAALLIYLAHTGQTHRRDFLADLLWQSSSTKQSLTNLRTVLSRLRKLVGDELSITRTTVGLKPENLQQVDSVLLLNTLSQTKTIKNSEQAKQIDAALQTYQGEFLADFHLPETPQFNQWVAETREHIRREVAVAYSHLAHFLETENQLREGIQIVRRWLTVDGLNEAAHALLIQLLLDVGSPSLAIAHYEQLVTLLKDELGIAPSAETMALVSRARQSPPPVTLPQTAVLHNLPSAYNQFFGRQAVQQEIHDRLDQPWCRLVTLTGLGGVGKTRLATTIARSRLSQYRDGVWLAELAELDPQDDDLAEAIAVEIATALNLRLTGTATPTAQLLDHLQHKHMLLVLDNFEHLLNGRQVVLDIVQRCEGVQMLVTSREALKIRAEWAVPLPGLSFPASEADERPSDAVAMFIARCTQQQWGTITEDDQQAIRSICRLVGGLPLAIELAAALTQQLPAQAVREQLETSFDALQTELYDVPNRHRGLQVVFEMSWDTLSASLQQRLSKLSIFRGGFTAVAAAEIADADQPHLAALGGKSLLIYDRPADRYALHPVIRAYAAEKRPFSDPAPQKHARFFLTLLAQHTEPLQKTTPQKSMAVIEPEIENCRRAWQTGLAQQSTDLLLNAITSFSIYFQLRGLAREGEAVMRTTLDAAKGWGNDGISLATRAGLERARFQNRLGQYRLAIQTLQTTLKLATQANDRWAEGMVYVWWGESLWRLGNYDESKKKLTHALDIAHLLDASLIRGWCHHQLGIVNAIQSVPDVALKHLERASETWRALDNTNTLSVTLNSIGLVYRDQGNLTAAREAMEQALAICTEQDNRYLQAMLLNNLSSLYIEQKDYFGAQYYLQLGLELANASNSLLSQGDIYLNIGENYRSQGEDKLALENLEMGLKISERIGNRPSIAEGLCRIADLKRKQKKIQDAEKLFERALEIARQDSLNYLECEVLIGLFELFEGIDSEKAKRFRDEAVKLAKMIDHPQLLQRIEDSIRY